MSLFQAAGNNAPADAVAIIESGTFGVKQIAIPQKHVFSVTNTVVSGKVHLTARGGPTHSCHDWLYSFDGIAYTRMEPTMHAETDMEGLKPDTNAWFIHQLITKKGGQGLSDPKMIKVS